MSQRTLATDKKESEENYSPDRTRVEVDSTDPVVLYQASRLMRLKKWFEGFKRRRREHERDICRRFREIQSKELTQSEDLSNLADLQDFTEPSPFKINLQL
ncbi:unnamed protein product [Moneuplotes crassus]|uniref:Uncharacterized protein n=1 Tax=Euplotes crassus TaxID=5936 RepID=A0AAD1Y4R0_EUPCR|nr:unnamed protein product [Moneuplotes crassus]